MYVTYVKPVFDIIVSLTGLFLLLPVLLLISLVLMIMHQSNPLFFQTRVGQYGAYFKVIKFKTIQEDGSSNPFMKLLRKTKIDELPQLFNVLQGEMSLIGPRPDLPGYYDRLEGESRLILKLKPGITSYASIKFANEEELLAKENNPIAYNDNVLFPEKVKLNLQYYYEVSYITDIKILLKTILLPITS